MPESRGEWVIFVAGLAMVAGLVFLAVRGRHHSDSAAPRASSSPGVVTAPATTGSKPGATTAARQRGATTSVTATTSHRRAAKPRPAKAVVLTLTARGASTWVEVRASSSNGPVLFAGTLDPGTRKAFHAKRGLWARFGGA